MANMRTIMPSLQKAQPAGLKADAIKFASVQLPGQQRQTRIVKDTPFDEIAKEIATWIKG
jgi:electron transfer flavoprotein beta subunit